MNYSYQIGLRLVKPNPSVALTEHIETIENAVLEYNNVCLNNSINPKWIELSRGNVSKNSIVLTLHSTTELKIVGKALRHFSQLLIKNKIFSLNTFNGQLFKTFPVISTDTFKNNSPKIIEPKDIDDAVFLKSLIDYVLNKSDSDMTSYRRKRIALAKMKQIALESGILVIN